MAIQVRYFASLQEQIGRRDDQVDAQAAHTVREVWQCALAQRPIPPNTLCAVNQEYAGWDSAVRDGDEVAFFPPVTGG